MNNLYRVPDGMHPIETMLPLGTLDMALKWCEKNVKGDYRIKQGSYNYDSNAFNHTFYFEDKKDIVTFMLRWG